MAKQLNLLELNNSVIFLELVKAEEIMKTLVHLKIVLPVIIRNSCKNSQDPPPRTYCMFLKIQRSDLPWPARLEPSGWKLGR